MLKKSVELRSVRAGEPEPVKITLPKFEIDGLDFNAAEDRETAAKLLEAMGLQASFTAWKMMEIMNEKLDKEDPSTMKIADLSKAIQAISTSASLNFEKAGLIRTGVETMGAEADADEFKKPEYLRALKRAVDVLEKTA